MSLARAMLQQSGAAGAARVGAKTSTSSGQQQRLRAGNVSVSHSHSRRRGVSRTTQVSAALRDGQMVTVHYVLTFDDGEVADDTRARDAPATLTLGKGELFPAIEEGIKKMEVGDKKTIALLSKDAYGERDDQKIQKFPLTPEELAEIKEQVQPGQVMQMPNGAKAVCIALEDDGIVLDGNHPLAGRALTFEIELLKVASGPELFGVPIIPFDVNKVVRKQ